MKFEVGKYYKTRGGDKAVYIGENCIAHKKDKCVFGTSSSVINVHENGSYYKGVEDSDDIVGEWPEDVVCWVALDPETLKPFKVACEVEAENLIHNGYQVQQVTFKG